MHLLIHLYNYIKHIDVHMYKYMHKEENRFGCNNLTFRTHKLFMDILVSMYAACIKIIMQRNHGQSEQNESSLDPQWASASECAMHKLSPQGPQGPEIWLN